MSAEKCPNSYRKNRDVSLHCRAIEGEHDWCAYQQMCHLTRKFENTLSCRQCKFRDKEPVK